jgi:hypothetical protein
MTPRRHVRSATQRIRCGKRNPGRPVRLSCSTEHSGAGLNGPTDARVWQRPGLPCEPKRRPDGLVARSHLVRGLAQRAILSGREADRLHALTVQRTGARLSECISAGDTAASAACALQPAADAAQSVARPALVARAPTSANGTGSPGSTSREGTDDHQGRLRRGPMALPSPIPAGQPQRLHPRYRFFVATPSDRFSSSSLAKY